MLDFFKRRSYANPFTRPKVKQVEEVYYRIKIDTLNNGNKEYTPQAKVGNYAGHNWLNIVHNDMERKNYSITNTMSQIYKTEEEALDIIERYKKFKEKKDGEEVKHTEYKKL